MNVVVPVRRPDAILWDSTRLPGQHYPVEFDAERHAELQKDALRIEQQSARVDNCRPLSQLDKAIVQIDLQRETCVPEIGIWNLVHERGKHFDRISDQESVRRPLEKRQIQIYQMMRHLLYEENGSIRDAEDDVTYDVVTSTILSGHYLVTTRMPGSGDPQVMTVQRLVDDPGIGSLRKGVHQGC